MRLPWQPKPETVETLSLDRTIEADGRVVYIRSVEQTASVAEPTATMSADDVASIARASVAAMLDERQQVAVDRIAATVREIQRAPDYSSSPIPGTPPGSSQSPLTPVAGAPYPIYAYDNPIDYATPMPPQRRPRSVVSLQTLRTIADTYDVLRACIQHLKREYLAVPFKWIALEDDDDRKGTQRQIREMTHYCSEAGGLGGYGLPRSHFECELIEDLSVVGMAATFYDRNYAGGFNTVEAIDAATIRPNVDYFGWPDRTWRWEQWVWGVMTARYTDDDLRFSGMATNARSWSPYYASPVEWLISAVNTAIRSDDWNRRFFTDGNSADQVWALPETWTPDMVKGFTEYWDALQSGDSGARRKTRFIPGSSKNLSFQTRKDQDFSQLDLWLLRRTCAMFGVQPASIGFAGEQYKVSQEDSMESTSNFGVGVLLEWFETFYRGLAIRRGYDRVQPQYVRAREEKAKERAERNVILVGGGIKKPNEARQDEGLDPDPDGDVLIVPGMTTTLNRVLNPPAPVAAEPGEGLDPVAGGNSLSARKEADPDATRAALVQWERKALAAVRRGRDAAVKFESRHIGNLRRVMVMRDLAVCGSEDDVRAIFRVQMQPTVYLIRHAMTKLNDEHRVRSWKDPKLSKDGKKLADRIGRWMVGRSLTALKTSDLRRTQQTADRVSEVTGAPIVDVGYAWRPWNLGGLSGRFVADIAPIVEDYARNMADTPVERGESLNAFLGRFLPHLSDVLDKMKAGKHVGSIGIVTHGRNLKAAMAWLAAGAKGCTIDLDEFLNETVPMGGVLVLTWDGTVWQSRMVDVSLETVPDLDDLENGGLS